MAYPCNKVIIPKIKIKDESRICKVCGKSFLPWNAYKRKCPDCE